MIVVKGWIDILQFVQEFQGWRSDALGGGTLAEVYTFRIRGW